MFVANIEEMQMRESQLHASRRERAERRGEDDDDDEGSGSGSESGSDRNVDTRIDRDEAVARMAEARRARPDPTAVPAGASEEDATMGGLLSGIKSANPNVNRSGKSEFSAKDLNDADVVDQEARMSRKEREALEAQRRKDEYMRRHLAGETEAAKADLDRLAVVRRRREEARLKAEAEGRAPGMSAYGLPSDDEEAEEGGKAKSDVAKATSAVADMAVSESVAKKRAAALAEVSSAPDSEEALPKLKSMDIKKMNGDALKDALKARGLNVQGQKKDLIQRLIDYEAARK
jgi:hypothetical protein